MKKNLNLIFLILLFCVLFVPLQTQAQGVGIKISPTKIEDVVEPGETLSSYVKIKNNSPEAKVMYAYLKDFKAEGEGGVPKLIAPGSEKGYYLASWINITDEALYFEPYEEKTVFFTVDVPSNVGPGGYYGGIYFGTEPPRVDVDSEERGAGMAISQQAGSLVLLQVKGEVDQSAEIREFSTDKEVYSTPFDVNFIVRFENKGNVHVKPHGTITVENMFGREKAVVRVNQDAGNVLPSSIRRFEENWTGKFGFGRYTAKLALTYGVSPEDGGKGKDSLSTEQYFWIMPWKIVVPTVLSFIILILIFVLLLKLYKNKAVKRAMEQAGMRQVRYVKKYKGSSPVAHLSMIMIVIFIMMFLLITISYFLFFA